MRTTTKLNVNEEVQNFISPPFPRWKKTPSPFSRLNEDQCTIDIITDHGMRICEFRPTGSCGFNTLVIIIMHWRLLKSERTNTVEQLGILYENEELHTETLLTNI